MVVVGAVNFGAYVVVTSFLDATVGVGTALLWYAFVLETETLAVLAVLVVAVGLAAGMTDAVGFVAFVGDLVAELVSIAVLG